MGYWGDGLGWGHMGGWNHMGGWGHMGAWSGGGWIATLFGLTLFVGLLALLALGAIWLARRTRLQAATVAAGRSEPLELARHRLASGQITPTEFEELRQRLET